MTHYTHVQFIPVENNNSDYVAAYSSSAPFNGRATLFIRSDGGYAVSALMDSDAVYRIGAVKKLETLDACIEYLGDALAAIIDFPDEVYAVLEYEREVVVPAAEMTIEDLRSKVRHAQSLEGLFADTLMALSFEAYLRRGGYSWRDPIPEMVLKATREALRSAEAVGREFKAEDTLSGLSAVRSGNFSTERAKVDELASIVKNREGGDAQACPTRSLRVG